MSTTLRLFLGIFAVLGLASSIALGLRYMVAKGRPHAVIDNLIDRINAWWVMVALVALAFAFGEGGVIVLFALLSVLALREFVTLTYTRRSDHLALAIAAPSPTSGRASGHPCRRDFSPQPSACRAGTTAPRAR